MKSGRQFGKYIFNLLLLLSFLLFNANLSFAQTVGQKFIMEITPDTKKFPAFEQTDVSSTFQGVIRNGDVVSVLQKKEDWIKITLPSGKSGWVKYYSSGSDFESWKFIPIDSRKKTTPQSQQIDNAQDINARLTMLENKVKELETMVMKLSAGASSTSAAFSPPAKPFEDEIKSAVTNHLKHNVPITWAGNLMGGKNAQLSLIQVVQIGSYNQQQKYWPMRIRCVGKCEMNDMFNQGKWNSFDRVGEFILFQDDYGNWKAQMKEGLFQ